MGKIRPPRIPLGETRLVTIANQEKQISLLLDRCEELRRERDEFERKYRFQSEIASDLAGKLADVQTAYTRMEGWRDLAREIIGSIEGPVSRG